MKKQQATMAMYKKAGINPMAGCVPMLLANADTDCFVSVFSLPPSNCVSKLSMGNRPFEL